MLNVPNLFLLILKTKKMKNFFTAFFTVALVFFLASVRGNSTVNSNQSTATWMSTYDDCFVINKSRSISALLPTFSRLEASSFMPCPTNQSINLQPGECGAVVDFQFGFPSFTATDLIFNQVNNPNLVNSTIYCDQGQTSYSRTYANGSPTDVTVKNIRLGVYEAVNAPVITINIYDGSNTLLGTELAIIPNLLQTLHTITLTSVIKIPALSTFRLEIVSNAPVISSFKIGRNNQGNQTSFGDATVIAANCVGSPFIVSGPSNADAIILGLTATPDDYRYVDLNSNPLPGEYFGIGSYNMSYVVTDANGISTACPFVIDINEYIPASNVIACNDLVQVSLGDDCVTVVTPQMLLEGDYYRCFDKYTVQIIANNGVNLGNTVTQANIGQTLKTQVIGPDGNSCWGEIVVQDKFGPTLICEDIYATCSTDLTPGSALSPRVPVSAVISDGVLSSSGTSTKSFSIPVSNIKGSTITDLNVFIDIEHARISDLAANITSPDGVTVPLMLLSSNACTGSGVMVTFDDEATSSSLALLAACEPTTPTITGSFAPINALSAFDGKALSGNWVVNIFDLVAGVGGQVRHIDLVFTQTGGQIPFPTPNQVVSTHISDNLYLVSGLDACGSATLSYTDTVIEEDCASIYIKVIERCWTGVDSKDNPANECCQKIYVYRNGLSTLQFPPNFDGLNGNPAPLSCTIYSDSIPPTSVTGLPFGDLCYNVQIAEPTDVRIDLCANSYKLIRTHKVIEWCSGQVIVHNQIIKVEDKSGPELTCPSDVTISTDDYACSATYVVPRPEIGEECSSVLTYILSFNPHNTIADQFITDNVDQNSSIITGLPQGDSWIKWTVTDECGNSSECTYKVTVVDDVKPNAVCDVHTVASISGNGVAVIEAKTFDDGSYDNCGVMKFEARKMTDVCGFGTSFGADVRFCCEEVGTTVMVAFMITDLAGNTNVCMVEVSVQDKLPPYITKCPADITLDCQADYGDLAVTGEPDYVDNCEVISVKHQDNISISQCGVGTVTRVWTVEDKQGYKNSCVQVITLVDKNPFRESEIKWPANYETFKCHSALDPASLPAGQDKPTFSDDNCSLVAAHYKDQVFKFVDGACEKVLRTWTVIDWCTYNDANPVLGEGWYEHIQIIKLQNNIAPIFEFACTDRTVAGYGNCDGNIDITMSAIDDCPEDNTNLLWKCELDIDNNGTIDQVLASNTITRTVKVGTHKIKWTAEDKCGNKAYCTQLVTVVEAKKPTPYCLSSITTAVMNSNGSISIWAKDYDLGSFDNCTPAADLWFTFYGATPVRSKLDIEHYFKGNGLDATAAEYAAGTAQIWIPARKTSGIVFDCNDIPNKISQEVSVDMWVTDLAGNQDYCTVTLVLQDNTNFCPDNSEPFIVFNGRTATNGNLGISGANVSLESSVSELNKSITTDATGSYSFTNLPKNNNYTVRMSDNRDILNGVSTLDLVMIQRHILGLDMLDGPTKIIAADVDNNAKVTAADLTALRKNILGITNSFPNGQQSWRFVTSNHTYSSPTNPFPFTENYSYTQLQDNKVSQNFVAIKIGDVNNSAVVNVNNPSTESRSAKLLTFQFDNVDAQNGQEVVVPIYAQGFTDLLGFQSTFQFDANKLELVDILPNALNIQASNFGTHRVSEGLISCSWNDGTPISIPSSQPLFTLVFSAKSDIASTQAVDISSIITPSVAFDNTFSAIKLTAKSRTSPIKGYELLQNEPNPFNDRTTISFVLPTDGKATLKVFDITGKVAKVITGIYPKGLNSIVLDSNELEGSGIWMYQIESGSFIATKKMIIIE